LFLFLFLFFCLLTESVGRGKQTFATRPTTPMAMLRYSFPTALHIEY